MELVRKDFPIAQVGDKTIDWLDPAAFKYKITNKEKRRPAFQPVG